MATPLEQLGEHVALALEGAAPERTRAVEEARRGFLQQGLRARTPAAGDWAGRLAWAGGTAIAVAAAVLLIVSHRRTPLTFAVNGSAGAAKSWLAAPESSPLNLAFSEGTQIRLEATARATVAEIDAHGASLALEGGRLHAEVVHRGDSAWQVQAGPFTVAVTGTVFDVNWEPNSQQLIVSVSRGSVAVRDSNTGVVQAVRATETLHSSAPEHHFELTRADATGASHTADSAVPVAPDAAQNSVPSSMADAGEAALGNPNGLEPSKDESPGSQWRVFAKHGALREAFASADAAGFAHTCASASPGELLLLGDGARLSGRPERATEALLTLRRRYPNDPRRAAAAFALGKVAFDQRGAYEQAAEWFSTSLREQPGGPLAREASGRLIEALRRADDSAGARRAARNYLERYPEGPHADLARSVLR